MPWLVLSTGEHSLPVQIYMNLRSYALIAPHNEVNSHLTVLPIR